MERIVTIFGGSKCGEESEEYEQARRLGQLLAERGFTICTGGYLGVMEGASRGAHERGGRVVGVLMNQFKTEPNRYLTEKVASAHFYERLQNLITRSVGFVAVRGGAGTVTELSLVWNKLQTKVIEPRPPEQYERARLESHRAAPARTARALLAAGHRIFPRKPRRERRGRVAPRLRQHARRGGSNNRREGWRSYYVDRLQNVRALEAVAG